MDHPFHNGNKRTAIVSLLVYLDKNGWVFTAEEDEIYVYLLNLASHQLRNGEDQIISNSDNEVLHLAKWLQNKIRKVNLREFPIQFRQLRSILLTYGCRFEFPTAGNRINIFRDKLHTQIGYHNEGTDVERGNIHKLRKDLALDEDSGYDSDIFYNATPRIPDFINKYRKLLDRLAKV
jgi:death-on-curing protein